MSRGQTNPPFFFTMESVWRRSVALGAKRANVPGSERCHFMTCVAQATRICAIEAYLKEQE